MAETMIVLDDASFESIYRRHWEAVYAVCFHYVENRQVAEDLVQEIFQSLWERRDTLVIETSAEHYLLRAAKLKVFHYLRTSRLHKQHHQALVIQLTPSENSTENNVLYKELSGKISRLVNTLPSQPRTVYTLSRVNGLKNVQIASEMDLSEKTVKNHLTRALHFLRDKLKQY